MLYQTFVSLTHWGRVMHICIGNLTIIGSDNGLLPGRCQAIIWTSARILLIRPLGTNFSENLICVQRVSFKKMHLKMSSPKWGSILSQAQCVKWSYVCCTLVSHGNTCCKVSPGLHIRRCTFYTAVSKQCVLHSNCLICRINVMKHAKHKSPQSPQTYSFMDHRGKQWIIFTAQHCLLKFSRTKIVGHLL